MTDLCFLGDWHRGQATELVGGLSSNADQQSRKHIDPYEATPRLWLLLCTLVPTRQRCIKEAITDLTLAVNSVLRRMHLGYRNT